jgi:hypothetical protein
MVARVPRTRGGFSGVLLILLGAWAGLGPLIGPYFHFAYTPDTAWAYSSGRLWLSIVPGGAALLGGLIASLTAHRAGGIFGALLGVLGGVWLVVGVPVIAVAYKSGPISPGHPVAGTLGSLGTADKQFLEQFAFFTGVGVLILFFAALALGRFTVVGVRDVELAQAEDMAGEDDGDLMDDTGYNLNLSGPITGSYPTTTGQYPSTGQYPGGDSPFPRSPGPGPLRGPGS